MLDWLAWASVAVLVSFACVAVAALWITAAAWPEDED